MKSKIILILLLSLSFNILSSQSKIGKIPENKQRNVGEQVEDNDFPEYNTCLENRIDKILSQFLTNLAPEKDCFKALATALDEANDAKNLARKSLTHMNRYLHLEFPIDHKPLTCTKLFQLLKRISKKYTPNPDIEIRAIEAHLNYRLLKINC